MTIATIVTEKIGGHWKASLQGRSGIHNHGSTEDDAVLKLIISRPDVFGIKIEKIINGKRIESTSVT